MTFGHDWRQIDRPFSMAGTMARSEAGATAIEYALIASLIAAAIVGALGGLGDNMRALPLPMLVDAFASVL